MSAIALTPSIAGYSPVSDASTVGAAPTTPVQQTNILQILREHLPGEHAAVIAEITALTDRLASHAQYREQLERIAREAGVELVGAAL